MHTSGFPQPEAALCPDADLEEVCGKEYRETCIFVAQLVGGLAFSSAYAAEYTEIAAFGISVSYVSGAGGITGN